MEHIIQMTATAGLTVPHSINPIFQYIFDCLSFNLINDNFDFVFQGFNCLWMVSVTLILNGSPQKIVQRGQITAPRRSINIRISADYPIFENGARKIDCYVGCVAPSFLDKMLSMSCSSITAAPCSFSKKNGLMMAPYQNPHQKVIRCGYMGFSIMTFGFSEPPRVEISRALYEPLGDVEAHLKHFKPPQPL